MKTIGLLGGMSWESTALYYRLINEETKRVLGGLHSAPIAMVSVDFAPVEALQHAGDWAKLGEMLAREARSVERAGADLLLICTNTMHKLADVVSAAIEIPLLHLADATAAELAREGVRRAGLLGTKFTMEQEFYRGRLEKHGIGVLVPDDEQRDEVHRVIYEELCLGQIREESRESYLETIEDLRQRGAEGIVLGCTEIGMLVDSSVTNEPLYDTTAIHARAAVRAALD